MTKRTKVPCGSLIQAYLPVLELDFITYNNFCCGLVEGISASVDSTGYDNEVQVDELEVICTASYTACSCTKKKYL